ncbi:MAG: hypothetical protein ACSLE5_16110 [Porticoccaceae bacterium]
MTGIEEQAAGKVTAATNRPPPWAGDFGGVSLDQVEQTSTAD